MSAMLVAIGLGATIPAALAADRVEAVKFKPGGTSTTLRGSIRGYDGIRYSVGASAGQVMSVLFSPSNRSCYMNVSAPGAASAAFNGSVSGNKYAANLSASGEYAIQVYLMRNAARRNEKCRYRLTIEITGAPGGASAGTSDMVMQDRCKGEAAGMYGVQPKQITTGSVTRVAGGYQIDGTADKGAEGVKKLRCIFSAGRSFDRIMAMTPDGE
ncbi:MAG: hypothetical protein DI543_05515 [Bradyrhizobium icense]|nr:MAG: hypothetical protein DI543_05515 [Bradyrhizobium icense]